MSGAGRADHGEAGRAPAQAPAAVRAAVSRFGAAGKGAAEGGPGPGNGTAAGNGSAADAAAAAAGQGDAADGAGQRSPDAHRAKVREAVSRFGAAGSRRSDAETGAGAGATAKVAAAKVNASKAALRAGVHGATTGALEGGDYAVFKQHSALSAARARRLAAQLKAEEEQAGNSKPRGVSYKKSDLGGTTAAGLQGLLEKGQTVEAVFEKLDADGSGLLDQEELVQGMQKLGTFLSDSDLEELKGLLGLRRTAPLEVNLEQFKSIVDQTPAANAGGTETGAWITQLHLYESFIPLIDAYEYLPEADDKLSAQDKLAHVRGLQEADVRQIVTDASEKIVEKLLAGVKALKDLFDQRMASSRDMQNNSKFSGDAGGGQITMVYGKLDEFHDGLESIIGLPNPRVFEGMRIDHCERADSEDNFTAWCFFSPVAGSFLSTAHANTAPVLSRNTKRQTIFHPVANSFLSTEYANIAIRFHIVVRMLSLRVLTCW